jgi:hypothetical protein
MSCAALSKRQCDFHRREIRESSGPESTAGQPPAASNGSSLSACLFLDSELKLFTDIRVMPINVGRQSADLGLQLLRHARIAQLKADCSQLNSLLARERTPETFLKMGSGLPIPRPARQHSGGK